jgi:hypothetical protein
MSPVTMKNRIMFVMILFLDFFVMGFPCGLRLQIPSKFPGVQSNGYKVPLVQVMFNCSLHFIPGQLQIICGQFQGLISHSPDDLGDDILCDFMDDPVRL